MADNELRTLYDTALATGFTGSYAEFERLAALLADGTGDMSLDELASVAGGGVSDWFQRNQNVIRESINQAGSIGLSIYSLTTTIQTNNANARKDEELKALRNANNVWVDVSAPVRLSNISDLGEDNIDLDVGRAGRVSDMLEEVHIDHAAEAVAVYDPDDLIIEPLI